MHMEDQNPWWVGEEDYAYTVWKESPVRWVPDVVDRLSMEPFSLNFLYGPRQVGKTTAVKILIHNLLERENPKSIFYYSCDELTDFHELGEVIDNYISARDAWGIGNSFIFLDEITFVEEWWRAIKSRIDRGVFSGDVLTVTGSTSMDLMKQREFFPGRRGHGSDCALLPLSFSEYARVLGGVSPKTGGIEEMEDNVSANRLYDATLRRLFQQYLITGGFPLAIIDFHRHGKVLPSTLKTYLDWLRGDWLRAGKSEKYMKEVISYIIRARGSPISWNGIASETGINSPHTAKSYVEVLEGTFTAKVLHMLSQDSRVLYRKNKKVHFTDPLLYHAYSHYTGERVAEDWLVEGITASLLSRVCDTYYWKNSTEVDVVCDLNGRQIGFEVKWGIKRWRKPRHLHRAYLLDRDTIHLYLASI